MSLDFLYFTLFYQWGTEHFLVLLVTSTQPWETKVHWFAGADASRESMAYLRASVADYISHFLSKYQMNKNKDIGTCFRIASLVITSLYPVGQHARLPPARQPRDWLAVHHGAGHASVFILPNKPQNLRLALHLFSDTIHHHLQLPNSHLSSRSRAQPQQSPANHTFRYPPQRKLQAVWGYG